MVISLATESSGRNENMHVHTHACARRTSYTPGTHTHVCNQPRAKHHEQPALLPPPPGTLRRGPAEGPGGRRSSTATRSLVLPLAGRVVNCSRPYLVRLKPCACGPGPSTLFPAAVQSQQTRCAQRWATLTPTGQGAAPRGHRSQES